MDVRIRLWQCCKRINFMSLHEAARGPPSTIPQLSKLQVKGSDSISTTTLPERKLTPIQISDTAPEKHAMAAPMSRATIIQAPDRPTLTGPNKSIFLAGTTARTSTGDWRATLCKALENSRVTIFNPLRLDWDHTWKEDMSDSRFSDQVTWELDMQEEADLVVVFFHPDTLAPISLLEFGLAARSGKVIAVCLEGCDKSYAKKGNVQAVCARFQIKLLGTEEELQAAVLDFLAE